MTYQTGCIAASSIQRIGTKSVNYGGRRVLAQNNIDPSVSELISYGYVRRPPIIELSTHIRGVFENTQDKPLEQSYSSRLDNLSADQYLGILTG